MLHDYYTLLEIKIKFSSSVTMCVLFGLVISDSLQPHELYSLPDSSDNGIFQARILEWDAISSYNSVTLVIF